MIAPVVNWYFRQRYDDLLFNLEKSIQKQEEYFAFFLDRGSDTEYGQKFKFNKIKNYNAYRQNVPLTEYEDLKPYIERTMAGEQHLLWPGEITWFAKSSGTTGNTAKFIPISFESLEDTHFQGGRDILTVFCAQNPDSKIFQGKSLLIGGSHKVNQLNQRSFYGDLSAVLMNHLPTWANFMSTPDMEIALMENWDEKVERMAVATMRENVTNISGVPTWTLVLFRKLLQLTGKSNIQEVWPNLELYIHGGVNFGPYRQQFKAFLPHSNTKYLESYNASEGFFGIQLNPNSSELTLMCYHGVFYEFYPVSKGPEYCVPLSETVTGVNYAMVITTNSGLWRYKIGDTIQFTSVNPYTFKITGRTKLFINAFGEELVIENAENALTAACHATGAVVADFTAAPIYMDQGSGGHEWLIEFEKEPHNHQIFDQILDEGLQRNNSDYAAKRKGNIAMKAPTIRRMPKGTFYAWHRKVGKLGGQHKVPRLCNDRNIVDEILAMISPQRAI